MKRGREHETTKQYNRWDGRTHPFVLHPYYLPLGVLWMDMYGYLLVHLFIFSEEHSTRTAGYGYGYKGRYERANGKRRLWERFFFFFSIQMIHGGRTGKQGNDCVCGWSFGAGCEIPHCCLYSLFFKERKNSLNRHRQHPTLRYALAHQRIDMIADALLLFTSFASLCLFREPCGNSSIKAPWWNL